VKNPDSDLVTVITFTYAHHLAPVRGRLEAEGIECFTKDEWTATANPFISNAIGGIKLQVKSVDVERAQEILRQSGHLKHDVERPSDFYKAVDSFSNHIPLLSKLRFEFRFLILVAISVIGIMLIIYFKTRPSISEKLTANRWCVNEVKYHDKIYSAKTFGLKLVSPGSCDEAIFFNEDGRVSLPGFHSYFVDAHWRVRNDSVQIFGADSFSNVYNGTYYADFSTYGLELKSVSTSINCDMERPRPISFPW
jgi:hypothetical protein